ncbi:unnamed protein product, partial [marine sediment metagenome]
MKKALRKIASVGLLALASYLPMSCASFKPRSKPAYEYALSKDLEGNIAEALAEKLDSLDNNSQEFINIISDYSPELQKACVNSDILDNGHVSKRELENATKATL